MLIRIELHCPIVFRFVWVLVLVWLCFCCLFFLVLFCFWFLDSLLDCVEVLLLSFVVIQCDDLACFHNSFMARTNLCYDLAKATKASDGKKIQNDHLFELRSFAVQKVYLQGDITPLVKHMAFAGRMRRLDLQPIIRRIRAKQSRYFDFGIWMYTMRGERGSRLSGRPSK